METKKDNETQMVNPPESTKKAKMYKVKLLRDTLFNGKVVPAGTVLDLPAKEAKELIEFGVKGMYPFGGERGSDAVDAQKAIIRRAELVQDKVELF